MLNYQVILSSENSRYMAWQSKLFCHSAFSKLGQLPIVIVHGEGQLIKEFAPLRAMGCRIVFAPSFANHPTGKYMARNELGSLLVTSQLENVIHENILFCEPDMLFCGLQNYERSPAAQFYGYLDYRCDRVNDVLNAFGSHIKPEGLNEKYQIGVPYLLPRSVLRSLALRWFDVLDRFRELSWIDIMYAFGIAAAIEDIEIDCVREMDTNESSDHPCSRSLLHYCYGDDKWNKRQYLSASGLEDVDLREAQPTKGSVLAEILGQLREANEYYQGLSRLNSLEKSVLPAISHSTTA